MTIDDCETAIIFGSVKPPVRAHIKHSRKQGGKVDACFKIEQLINAMWNAEAPARLEACCDWKLLRIRQHESRLKRHRELYGPDAELPDVDGDSLKCDCDK